MKRYRQTGTGIWKILTPMLVFALAAAHADDPAAAVEHAKKEIAALEKAAEQVQKSLSEAVADLRKIAAHETAEAKQVEKEIVKEPNAAAAIEQEIKAMETKLVAVEKRMAAAKKQADAAVELSKAIAEQKAAADLANKTLKTAGEQRTQQEKRLADLNARQAAMEKTAADAEKQSKAAGELQAQLEQEKAKRKQMEDAAAAESAALQKAQKEADKIARDLADKERQLAVPPKTDTESLDSARKQLDAEKAQTREASDKLKDIQAARLAAEKKTADLKAQIAIVADKLHKADDPARALAEARDQIAKATRARQETENQLKAARLGLENTQKEVETLKKVAEDTDAAFASVTEKSSQVKELRGAIDAEQKLRQKAAEELAASTAAKLDADKRLAAIKQQVADARHNLAMVQDQVKQADQAKQALDQVRQARGDLLRRTSEINADQKQVDNDVAALQSDLKNAETDINKLKDQAARVAVLKEELAKAQADQANIQKQVAEAVKLRESAEKDMNAARKILDLRKQEIDGYRADTNTIEAVRRALTQNRELLAGIEKQIKAESAAREKTEKAWSELETQIQSAEKSIAELNTRGALVRYAKKEAARSDAMRQKTEAELKQAVAAREAEDTAKDADVAERLARLQDALKVVQGEIMKAEDIRANVEKQLRKEYDESFKEQAQKEQKLAAQITALQKQMDDIHARYAGASKTTAASAPPAAKVADDKALLAKESELLKGETTTAASEKSRSSGGWFGKSKTDENTDWESHYQQGLEAWEAGNMDAAIRSFKSTIKYNASAAGAYYNLALCYLRKGDKREAASYAFKAGQLYNQQRNRRQAYKMVLFLRQIDDASPLIEKLNKEIASGHP